MAQVYREQIAGMREALEDEEHRSEAVGILRKLVDRIELTPVEIDGRKSLAIKLHGELAGILSMAAKTERPLAESELSVIRMEMVAGTRNHRNLPVEILALLWQGAVRPFDAAV